jgi:hypothetical protein
MTRVICGCPATKVEYSPRTSREAQGGVDFIRRKGLDSETINFF